MTPSDQNPSRSRLAVNATRISKLSAIAFVLALPWGASSNADTLYGLGADGDVRSDGVSVLTSGGSPSPSLVPGFSGSNPGWNRAGIFVFQLPDLGMVSNPFENASFTFNFATKSTSTPGNLDLQALDARSESTLLAGDYYVGTSPIQGNATPVQSAIVTFSMTPPSLITTDTTGSAKLVAYLNEQYDGGNGIGKYVFLRFNTLTVPASGRRYTLTATDGGAEGPPDTRPRIEYTVAVPPIVKADNSLALNNGSSWVNNVAPAATDVARWDNSVMGGANSTQLGTDATWGGIEIANPAGPVTINGSNLLTLGAVTTDINMSTATQNLTLNCGLALGDANVWNIGSGSTLTLGGEVSGPGSLTKQGSGTATLSAANTFTGTTAVNDGVLNLVTGTGSSTTDTTIAAAGTLKSTVTSPGQTWNLGDDLTCASGSTIQFDLQSATPSTTIAPLTVDNLDSSAGNITVEVLNLNASSAGDYPLIAFSSGTPAATDFTVQPPNLVAALKIVGNLLVLALDEVHTATSLTWTNAASTGKWNKTTVNGSGDVNWTNTTPAAASFRDTDSVTFNTSAFGGPITAELTDPVNSSGIVVSGPDDVTITSGGGIVSGTGGVTMNGGGVFDLQMDNSFTGKTIINSGTVVLSSSTNDQALNSSLGAIPAVDAPDQITINGGTLVPTTNPTPSFTLNAKSGVFIGPAGGTISLPAGKRLSIGKITSDSAAVTTVGGDGTLAFGGDQLGYLGKWILKGSVVTVAGEGRLGTVDGGPEPDNIILDGGHLQTTAGSAGVVFDDADRGITLSATGGRLSSNAANNGTYQIVIVGTAGGSLRIGDPSNSNAAQKVTFNAGHTYNGKTYIDRGILILGASGSIVNSPEIVLGSDEATTLDVSAASFELALTQTLSGSGSVLGAFSSNGTIAPGASTGAISFNNLLDLGTGTLKIEAEDAQVPVVDSIAVTDDLDISEATLNLDVNGLLTAPAYVIATYGSLSGTEFAAVTGDAIPAGYELSYNYNGNNIALVQQGGYAAWIATFFGSETNQDIVGPNADPDKDGIANIVEFALGASAPNSGSARPSLFEEITGDHLILTVPVLNVATFAGSPPSATVQGVTITAEGSDSLGSFAIGAETTTASPNAPAAPTGYTNHAFRLIPTVSGNPRGFLRMKVE